MCGKAQPPILGCSQRDGGAPRTPGRIGKQRRHGGLSRVGEHMLGITEPSSREALGGLNPHGSGAPQTSGAAAAPPPSTPGSARLHPAGHWDLGMPPGCPGGCKAPRGPATFPPALWGSPGKQPRAGRHKGKGKASANGAEGAAAVEAGIAPRIPAGRPLPTGAPSGLLRDPALPLGPAGGLGMGSGSQQWRWHQELGLEPSHGVNPTHR